MRVREFLRRPAALTAAAIAVSFGVLSAVAVAGGSTKDGAFTSDQAARGKAVYDKSCVTCHPAEFYRERLGLWQNKPVEELFEIVSTTMPSDKPGALLTSEYVDVLAYIFSITGAPAGSAELTTENMGEITVGPVQ